MASIPRGSSRGFRGRADHHATTRPTRGARGGGARPPGPSIEQPKQPKAPGPTHFLAIPLNNHPALRERISSFQAELIRGRPPIPGLDSSIVIDPRRMHITLGVMHLEQDIPSASHSRPDKAATIMPSGQENPKVRHTVSTALDLLRSLQPQLAQTSGTKLSITLDSMDIFQPQRNFGEAGALGANVLFIGPSNSDDKRLRDICDMTHRTFRQHGYITEKRPLKLHCSILNTSHRKPRRRQPFSYSAILASNALRPLTCLPSGADPTGPPEAVISAAVNPPGEPAPRESRPESKTQHVNDKATAISVNLGTWEIHRIELWVMGSHGPNNEYISCGGIGLDSASK